MQLGMIGLGRMGANMVSRLLKGGHQCTVFDRSAGAVRELVKEKAVGTASPTELAGRLTKPRAVWMMVPVGAVDQTIGGLVPHLHRGDILVDGGNSHYIDDIRRAKELGPEGIHYIDVGTSGGVASIERGYCLMIGGPPEPVSRLDGIFGALAPGPAAGAAQGGTATRGYLHCGPHGAGHFVKMVHNGIEYGLMAAYAEGLNILHHADIGKGERTADAETAPLAYMEQNSTEFVGREEAIQTLSA